MKRTKNDRGKERQKRQRRFERNRRAASKERLDTKKGTQLNVLEKGDTWISPKELERLKDAPDDIQYRDG